MVECVPKILPAALPDQTLEGTQVEIMEVLMKDRVKTQRLNQILEAGNLHYVQAIFLALPEPLVDYLPRIGDVLQRVPADHQIRGRHITGEIDLFDKAAKNLYPIDGLTIDGGADGIDDRAMLGHAGQATDDKEVIAPDIDCRLEKALRRELLQVCKEKINPSKGFVA